mmetsp:Transcript_31175/g.23170  ORF Transcript_31175/g.23170 Transcript_31175/m.23170 type:complete len:84 (-) Transcript_31175:420-671(-)
MVAELLGYSSSFAQCTVSKRFNLGPVPYFCFCLEEGGWRFPGTAQPSICPQTDGAPEPVTLILDSKVENEDFYSLESAFEEFG